MTLLKQLISIAEERAEATKDSKRPLFQSQKNDLYGIDADVLANDSQAGDTYVWSLRGTSCGTNLTRFGSEDFETYIKCAPEGSEFYLLKCSGINEGTVKQISFDQALNLEDLGIKANEDRVPRRQHLYRQLNEILGLQGDEGLEYTVMGSEFAPNDGDKAAIRIQQSGHRQIAIDIVRTKSHDYNGKVEQPRKAEARYYAPEKSINALDLKSPTYFAIESQRSGNAKLSSISKNAFDKAVKKVRGIQDVNYAP